ncbi:hypothetical protein G6045_20250 [Streptomyces sp. YC504]|uniref:Uncharacterized protein n=1 Tax=Streptomyces mesophilus TaxID=1775132 RepID=A0A6G4XKA3_9ACTN|nr:hypothetical protein [Streptomyces mesophilus]NGO77975.1 hypothetical protein [Streptomyces mesophilus]
MSTWWGLIVEETDGMGERKAYAANVLDHVEGTREEALVELEKRARGYVPQHPMNPSATRLYRTDEGFLLVSEGSMRNYGCRFSVGELLYDSVQAEKAAAAQRAAEAEERQALRRAEAEERAARKAAEKAAKRAQRGGGKWWGGGAG